VPKGFKPTLDGMALFVAQILESAGVKPPINLIAHDFGGPFAFAWAVKHPDSVCHMVATNTLFFSDYKWHFWAQVWLTPVLGQLSMAIINPPMFSRELSADPAARSTMSISRT
jgi:pimeloyl-ACP methyl ester carboxylesterase